MKKTTQFIALLMALLVSVATIAPMNVQAIARSGKKVKIRYELYDGESKEYIKGRPSPDENPTYQDGSKDEELINFF